MSDNVLNDALHDDDEEIDLELVDPEKKFAELTQQFLKSSAKVADDLAVPPLADDGRRSRPDISHLDLAVDVDDAGNVTFIPEVGQKVVIERVTSLLPTRTWLDTSVYTVKDIDPETGALTLYSEELGQWGYSNFMEGLLMGYSFRLPPKRGPVIPRRTRLKKAVREELRTLEVPERTPGVKKGRGRPKGSKNRPRAVVKAEKVALADLRRAKRAAKKARR